MRERERASHLVCVACKLSLVKVALFAHTELADVRSSQGRADDIELYSNAAQLAAAVLGCRGEVEEDDERALKIVNTR